MARRGWPHARPRNGVSAAADLSRDVGHLHRGDEGVYRGPGDVDSPRFGGRCPVSSGTVNLLLDAGDAAKEQMRSRLFFTGADGRPYTLAGFKDIAGPSLTAAWTETTTLYTQVLDGHVPAGATGTVVESGVLVVRPEDFFFKQLFSAWARRGRPASDRGSYVNSRAAGAQAIAQLRDIVIQDGASFAVRGSLKDVFPGRFTTKGPAVVELHATCSGYADAVTAIHLAPDCEGERPCLPEPRSAAGCLSLADRGYPSVPCFTAAEAQGGAFTFRLSTAQDPYVMAA